MKKIHFLFLFIIPIIESAIPSQGTCGTPTTSPTNVNAAMSRIILGEQATANSWPW